ncbi:MAG TPA: VTT domain-containing protein [Isosphaeraceae bacterium]|nr:VTT domain-containing protein [Isosphaeraceae bacterium]
MSTPAPGPGGVVKRYAGIVQWASVALIALSVLSVNQQIPLARLIEAFDQWITSLGLWGPVIYGLFYALAVVALIPAWTLTVAAGSLFGLVAGMITVSLASTTGAALAFLVARHLARDAVARKLARDARFAAIDRAVQENGWKIVALLRLSPAVPFNLQNYLYGLTGIPFWTYVLISWISMLPGTLLYVYLGYAGRISLEAAAGGETPSRSPAERAMFFIGLLATIVLTIYITRLARNALRQRTDQSGVRPPDSAPATESVTSARWPWSATASAALALASVSAAVIIHLHPQILTRLFERVLGPPPVTLREAYAPNANGPRFDHSLFDELVRAHVDRNGQVDYRAMMGESAKLDAYLEALAKAPFDALGRDEKLALLLNSYNACTIRLILDHIPIASILSVPTAQRWDAKRWRIGGHTWSLNQIEHEQIRPKFREPRIHFALVCAAQGCPPLRREAYQADRLDEQLEDQARTVHSHGRWFQLAPDGSVVWLTRLYQWYRGDFDQVSGSILKFAARYSADLKRLLDAGRAPGVRWLDYDWSLNAAGPPSLEALSHPGSASL